MLVDVPLTPPVFQAVRRPFHCGAALLQFG